MTRWSGEIAHTLHAQGIARLGDLGVQRNAGKRLQRPSQWLPVWVPAATTLQRAGMVIDYRKIIGVKRLNFKKTS